MRTATALTHLVLVLHLTAALPGAVTITTALKEGDAVPGVGNVTLIDNVAVNDAGDWIVEVDTDFANTNQDQALVKNGAVFVREDQALADPPGSRVDSFDSVNLNNAGHGGWNFFLAATGGTFDDSGIFYDDDLVIQESDISTAPQFTPGTPYIGFFDAKPNNTNQIMIVASIDDPAIPSTVDRALVIATHDGSGGLVSESVLLKEADFPPGETDSITDFGTGPHESAFNDGGDILFFADLTGNTATDGSIYLNTTLLAQEGSPSPAPARNYELLSGRGLDLNNSGGYVFKANLDGATTDDDLIVRNGGVFIREGDGLESIGPFAFTAFGLAGGPVQIDDFGRVLWFGDWNDPNTNVDTGLFLDDALIVQEGVTTIGGVVVDEISNGQDAFMISDNGAWAIFEGTLVGGISGAFLIELSQPPTAVTGLASLAALPAEEAIRIAWTVRTREEYQGFYVLRAAEGGPFEHVTEMLPNAANTYPADFSWTDASAVPGVEYAYRIEVVHPDGTPEVWEHTVYASALGRAPLSFALRATGPSPFRVGEGTSFAYDVPRPGAVVSIRVFDVSGRSVATLLDGHVPPGSYAARWSPDAGRRFASGVYFVRLESSAFSASERVVLLN
jgi:hypothetical protein